MKYWAILLLCMHATCSIGQIKKIVPQFTFGQIDSLITSSVAKILKDDSSAIVVTSVRWNMGAHVYPRDTNFSSYRNPFDIYILFSSKRNYYMQEIDNFGYFKKRKIVADSLKQFLSSHFALMCEEELKVKSDTVYDAKGGMRVSHTFSSHGLFEIVKILFNRIPLKYTYSEDMAANKKNLTTYQYKFLKLVNQIQEEFEHGKHKRLTVVHGYAVDE